MNDMPCQLIKEKVVSYACYRFYTILEYLSYPQCYQRAMKGTNPHKSWSLLPKILLLDTSYRTIIKITIYQLFII